MKTPIQKSIQIVGSMAALARLCGVRNQAVQRWVKFGRIPAERVLAVEAATQGRVTRYELRPDIYPPVEADNHYQYSPSHNKKQEFA